VQSALNSSPVVIPEATYAGDYIVNVLLINLLGVKDYLPMRKAGFRGATQVKDYLQ
jgi:hypothetical protein